MSDDLFLSAKSRSTDLVRGGKVVAIHVTGDRSSPFQNIFLFFLKFRHDGRSLTILPVFMG